MPVDFQLNVPQQVFTLFYAITWGTAANSQPRWKGFAWGVFFSNSPARWRAALSMIVLNIVPLIYFVIILWCLGSGSWTGISHWNLKAAWKSLLSTIPALAPFGFYRIWTGFVEFSSQLFYGVSWPWNTNNPPQALTDFGIHLGPSDLNPNFACGNFMWGLIYVGVGLIIALIGIFF